MKKIFSILKKILTKNQSKEPSWDSYYSEALSLEKISATKIDTFIKHYYEEVESLINQPDELEKKVEQLENKLNICNKMIYFLGKSEFEYLQVKEKKQNWKISIFNIDSFKYLENGSFEFKYENLKIIFTKPENSGYDDSFFRNISILEGNKIVAEYAISLDKLIYGADWSSARLVLICKFKPEKWIHKLLNFFGSWIDEYSKIIKIKEASEIEEFKKDEEKRLRDNFL